jgi:hypothetical protein
MLTLAVASTFILLPHSRYHRLLKMQDDLVEEKRLSIQNGKGAVEIDARLKDLREKLSDMQSKYT